MTESMAATRQYATFLVDEMSFGIEVLRVQEVLRFQSMTPVPRGPRVVEGLINLRGQIVTALDVRRCLRLSPGESGKKPMNVVLRSEGGPVSLLVDEIGDVVEVPDGLCEQPPLNLRPELRRVIRQVCKLEGQLLLILDVDRILAIDGGN